MHFALIAYDRPNAVAERAAIRPQHLNYRETLGDRLVLAGPFLNDRGEGIGTILIIEAPALEAARESFADDPYAIAGLFDSVTIKPWRLSINKTR
ncbi:MAG: YciI family protein [Devosia sp.]